MQLEENIIQAHMLLTLSRNMHVPAIGRCAGRKPQSWVCSTLFILQKSRMRRRARTDLCGLRLETHEVQSPEMEIAAKPSSQPRTKSCVMSGDGHCEA